MKRFAPIALAAIAALAGGCRKTGSGPEGLRVAETFGGGVWLAWYPPSTGDFSGYVLEWRVPGGAFAPLATFGASEVGGTVSLGLDVPDAVDIELRLTATPDPDGTRSATAVLQREPRPPSIACKTPSVDGCRAARDGIHLRLQNRSPGATALFLRSSKFPPGETWSAAARSAVELPPDTLEYVDTLADGWSEQAEYEYRLTAVKNGRESYAYYGARSEPLPLLAPSNVSVLALPEGKRVSFENRSALASCYTIDRANVRVASCVTPPAVGAVATFLDPGAAGSTGPSVYRITPVRSYASGFPMDAWDAPALPAGLSARLVTVSPGTTAVRLSTGAFATAQADYASYSTSDTWSAFAWAPGPFGSYPIPAEFDGYATLAVDPDDGVHVLAGVGGPALHHATFAAGRWSVEDVPSSANQRPVVLEVGIDGTVRAGWAFGQDVVIATRSATGWVLETLSGALPAGSWSQLFSMATDAAGVVHLVHGGSSSGELVYRSRTSTGWTSETITEGASRVTLLAAAGSLRILAERSWTTDVLERTDTGWTIVESLPGKWIGSRSADGSAIVLAGPSSLRVVDAGGVRTVARPDLGSQYWSTGIGNGGKAWVLDLLLNDVPHDEITAALYEEP